MSLFWAVPRTVASGKPRGLGPTVEMSLVGVNFGPFTTACPPSVGSWQKVG